MKEPKKTGFWGQYLPCILISALIFIWVADGNGLLSPEDAQTFFGRLCDCFFISGAIFSGMGLITWMATTGVYDMLGYGGHYAYIRLKQIVGGKEAPGGYFDYREQKAQKRGGRWKKNWLIVGGIELLLSGVCLALYYML